MRVVNIVLMVFGAIFIVLLIFMIIGYSLFSFAPDIKSQMTISKGTAEGLASYETKVSAFSKEVQAASTANQTKNVTLILTADEINSKISEMLAEEKLPFKELAVNLGDRVCSVYFMADTPVSVAKIGMVLSPAVVKNDIQVTVSKFQLGKLPVPKSFDTYAGYLANNFLNTENPFNDLPVDLKSVTITTNQLTLKFATIPAR